MKHQVKEVSWKLGKSAILRERLKMAGAFCHLGPRFAKARSGGAVNPALSADEGAQQALNSLFPSLHGNENQFYLCFI